MSGAEFMGSWDARPSNRITMTKKGGLPAGAGPEFLAALQRQMRGESIARKGSMRIDPNTLDFQVPVPSSPAREVPLQQIAPIVDAVVDLLTPYIDGRLNDKVAATNAGLLSEVRLLRDAVSELRSTVRNLGIRAEGSDRGFANLRDYMGGKIERIETAIKVVEERVEKGGRFYPPATGDGRRRRFRKD